MKGYRTLLANAAILLLVVTDYLADFDFSVIASPQAAAWAIMTVNLINIALRLLTTTPVGMSE